MEPCIFHIISHLLLLGQMVEDRQSQHYQLPKLVISRKGTPTKRPHKLFPRKNNKTTLTNITDQQKIEFREFQKMHSMWKGRVYCHKHTG